MGTTRHSGRRMRRAARPRPGGMRPWRSPAPFEWHGIAIPSRSHRARFGERRTDALAGTAELAPSGRWASGNGQATGPPLRPGMWRLRAARQQTTTWRRSGRCESNSAVLLPAGCGCCVPGWTVHCVGTSHPCTHVIHTTLIGRCIPSVTIPFLGYAPRSSARVATSHPRRRKALPQFQRLRCVFPPVYVLFCWRARSCPVRARQPASSSLLREKKGW